MMGCKAIREASFLIPAQWYPRPTGVDTCTSLTPLPCIPLQVRGGAALFSVTSPPRGPDMWPFCILDAGVNLLVGTESGLMLLDRSGQGKVYPLINRRRFQQMDVLEGLNVLVTISGRCCDPVDSFAY